MSERRINKKRIKISFYLTVKLPPYRYIFAYICMCVYKHANVGITKIVIQKFLELAFWSLFSLKGYLAHPRYSEQILGPISK